MASLYIQSQILEGLCSSHSSTASTCSSVLLTNLQICTRVFTIIKVNFPKLDAAEKHYNLTLSNCLEEMEASIDVSSRYMVQNNDCRVSNQVQSTFLQIHVEWPTTKSSKGSPYWTS
ncbi:hypothetical protein ACROYT_G014220 [Oculina patagonica]